MSDVLTPDAAHLESDLRVNPTLRGLAVCLDQIVNRAIDQERVDGKPWPIDSHEHASDLAYADLLVAKLEAAATVGRAMVQGIREQFPDHAPAPAPKASKR